jgi:acyl-CoA reductase-like NAD-dependent aldehyde dehydrogenase
MDQRSFFIGGDFAKPHGDERVLGYLELGKAEGARVVAGGGRAAGFDRGYYVAPTVFADVNNGMRIAREEIFGPVNCVIPSDTVEEAIAIANDSEYGPSGAVWARTSTARWRSRGGSGRARSR